MKHWPGIIELLGRDPALEPKTLGERLVAYRRRLGLSRKALAELLSADVTTVWRWEIGQRTPDNQTHLEAVRRLGLK